VDPTARKLCSLLRKGDPELKAAAARVLAELEPADPEVLAALGHEVRTGVGPAPLFALRALAASPSPQAVGHLVPALAGPPELRTRAVAALARFGKKALPALKTALLDADMPLSKAAASVLAAIGGKAAHQLLLRALARGHLDLSRHICFELDKAIGAMSPAARSALARLVAAYLAQKRTQANVTAAASGLILLGILKTPASKPTLLDFARPARPAELRRRALRALRAIPDALERADLLALSAYTEDADFANVAGPAIELLRPLPLPASAAPRLARLAAGPHQAAREFAIAKLGQLATPRAAKALVEQLHAPHPATREAAVEALQHNPAAAPLLLKRLETETDPNRLWTLARILDHHPQALKPATVKRLVARVLRHLEHDDRRAEPLAYLLGRTAPEPFDGALIKRALAAKRKGRFAEAHRMLALLLRGDSPPPEAIYQSAVVALKLSPKAIARSKRHADPCLDRFDRLVGNAEINLPKRLAAEKCLEPADLFYLGFHFVEQLGDRRELGAALLRRVVAHAPRSALAASARNKLRLEAFPTDKPPTPAGRRAAKPRPRKAAKPAARPKRKPTAAKRTKAKS